MMGRALRWKIPGCQAPIAQAGMLLSAGSGTVQCWAQPLLPGITMTQPEHRISQRAVGAHLSPATPASPSTKLSNSLLAATGQSNRSITKSLGHQHLL